MHKQTCAHPHTWLRAEFSPDSAARKSKVRWVSSRGVGAVFVEKACGFFKTLPWEPHWQMQPRVVSVVGFLPPFSPVQLSAELWLLWFSASVFNLTTRVFWEFLVCEKAVSMWGSPQGFHSAFSHQQWMKTDRRSQCHAKLVVSQARKGISASDTLCVMNQVLHWSPQSRPRCHDLALVGYSGWAVACNMSLLLHMSYMNFSGRFTFHINLGKLRSQRFNDPVLILWKEQQYCQTYNLIVWLSGFLLCMLCCSSVPKTSWFHFQVPHCRRGGYLWLLLILRGAVEQCSTDMSLCTMCSPSSGLLEVSSKLFHHRIVN